MNLLGLKIEADPSPTAKIKWTRRAGIIGAANLMVLGGGVAYASWSASGVGSAAAKATTSIAVSAPTTANVATGGGTLLYPGLSVPAVVNVHNDNPFDVKVTGYTITAAASPTTITGGTNNATCTTTPAVSVPSTVTVTGLNQVITAGQDGHFTTAGNVITMGSGSDTGCQGATFIFTSGVSITAVSN